MRRALTMSLLLLCLFPAVLAVVGEGETYQVRHKPDYDRFLNAFEPYKLAFLQEIRATHPTIYDARLRRVYTIESVNDDWLMQILFHKQSRDWNHIELPLEVLEHGLGTYGEQVEGSLSIRSGASRYPSFTKYRTGGTFISDQKREELFEVTPEMIQWVRLFKISVRNPVTQKNVRVAELSDEQISAYLQDKRTRRILNINAQRVKEDLKSTKAYYTRFRRAMPVN